MREDTCVINVPKDHFTKVGDILEFSDPVKLSSLLFCTQGIVISKKKEAGSDELDVLGLKSRFQTTISKYEIQLHPPITFRKFDVFQDIYHM
jgi:hypothetical protein